MRTFTLEQLTRFADIGMERLPMLRAMQALGMDEGACFTLPNADSTRKRDVVQLYWDYGGQYGAQLEQYIASVLVQLEGVAEGQAGDGTPRYSLGQLAWVHAIGMCKSDMVNGMMTMGSPADTALELAHAASKCGTVLGWWKDRGQVHGEAISAYLISCLTSYPPAWPHGHVHTRSPATNPAVEYHHQPTIYKPEEPIDCHRP
jgi:hypothetical protein